MSVALKMGVSIQFFGMQRAIARTDSIDMPITGETRVSHVLEYVRYHYPDLPLNEGTVLVAVNQRMATLDRVLDANDTVSFLPFIGGG